MSRMKHGDRVRVNFEGTVKITDGNWVYVMDEYELQHKLWDPEIKPSHPGKRVFTPAEPEYYRGDVYKDAGGVMWYRLRFPSPGLPWRGVGDGEKYQEDRPDRPLTRMVPEGQD